jgi:hypothetical protein
MDAAAAVMIDAGSARRTSPLIPRASLCRQSCGWSENSPSNVAARENLLIRGAVTVKFIGAEFDGSPKQPSVYHHDALPISAVFALRYAYSLVRKWAA